MRKVLFTIAAAAMACACSNSSQFSIKGKIENLNGKIYLVTADYTPIDSAEVQDGKIYLKGRVEEPVIAFLGTSEGGLARVVLENTRLTVSGDLNDPANIRVKGSPANDAYSAYLDRLSQLTAQFYDPNTTEEQRNEIIRQDSIAQAELIDANRDNILGAFLFCSDKIYGLNGEQIEAEVAKFSPEMQQTDYLQEALKEAGIQKKTAVGQPYMEITLPDSTGEQIALSAFVGKGKYVLLDFWASWCRPCMQELPYLIDAYNKYHAKGFEIYGVSLDENKSSWESTVKSQQMDWIQVSTLEGWECPAAQQYGIRSIPANLLIDPEGTIIAKNLRGEELVKTLAGLLDNKK